MILVAMSVRDLKAEAFGAPFFVQNIGIATRSFTDEVNREAPDNMYWKHADDFQLFEVGEFDDQTGTMKPSIPRLICCGGDVSRRNIVRQEHVEAAKAALKGV